MKKRISESFVVVAATLALNAVVLAEVTPVGYWRLGEADANAAADQPVVKATDAKDLHPGTPVNGPKYAAVAASSAMAATDSKLAVKFDGTAKSFLRVADLDIGEDNVGIEAFVRTKATEGFSFVVSAGAGSHGISLVHNNKGYQVLLGGINLLGWSGDVEPGEWVHVAVVRQNGKTEFYFNGERRGDTDAKPNAAGASFAIGASGDGKEGFFTGEIDEVRVFSFEPGKFDPKDLLVNQKPAP